MEPLGRQVGTSGPECSVLKVGARILELSKGGQITCFQQLRADDLWLEAHPLTYASLAATFPSRTVKTSTPRKCHGCPFRILR